MIKILMVILKIEEGYLGQSKLKKEKGERAKSMNPRSAVGWFGLVCGGV